MTNASEENRPAGTDTPAGQATQEHAPWCDPRQHISEQDSCGAGAACVSAAYTYGRFGGWVTAAGTDEPRIVLDKPGHSLDGDYSKDQVRELITEQLELAAYLTMMVRLLDRQI